MSDKDRSELRCSNCMNYIDGHCLIDNKMAEPSGLCLEYEGQPIVLRCTECGRLYEYCDSDASDREHYCCTACEYGM